MRPSFDIWIAQLLEGNCRLNTHGLHFSYLTVTHRPGSAFSAALLDQEAKLTKNQIFHFPIRTRGQESFRFNPPELFPLTLTSSGPSTSGSLKSSAWYERENKQPLDAPYGTHRCRSNEGACDVCSLLPLSAGERSLTFRVLPHLYVTSASAPLRRASVAELTASCAFAGLSLLN